MTTSNLPTAPLLYTTAVLPDKTTTTTTNPKQDIELEEAATTMHNSVMTLSSAPPGLASVLGIFVFLALSAGSVVSIVVLL